MALRNAALLLGILSLLLTACGGGGSDDVTIVEPLNNPEKALVGSYELEDFDVWVRGEAPRSRRDFETWSGRLELHEDRTASVRMELCERGTAPTAQCEREFVWTAETGTIHLHSLDSTNPDIRVEWSRTAMGSLTTHSMQPTNDPRAGLLLIEEGNETFHWRLVD